MHSIKYILAFIIGLSVGSFLNVCIYRLPKRESIIKPPSHCPHCKKPILWFDNIPLFSYLNLRGRCRFCGHKISFSYFLVELITASFFVIFLKSFGLNIIFLIYLLFLCLLIIASFVDIQHRIIPDEISIGGMFIGLILSLAFPFLHRADSNSLSLLRSFLGVLVGGGITYLSGIFGEMIFKKEAMGGGDVKLMGMIGAFLGPGCALLTFFIAPFLGSVVGIVNLLKKKTHLIAYGPFLSLGALVAMFWGKPIIEFLGLNCFSWSKFIFGY